MYTDDQSSNETTEPEKEPEYDMTQPIVYTQTLLLVSI